MERREFIKATAVIGGGCAVAGQPIARAATATPPRQTGASWFDRPMR